MEPLRFAFVCTACVALARQRDAACGWYEEHFLLSFDGCVVYCGTKLDTSAWLITPRPTLVCQRHTVDFRSHRIPLDSKESLQQRAKCEEHNSTAAVVSGLDVCLKNTLYWLRTKLEFNTFSDGGRTSLWISAATNTSKGSWRSNVPFCVLLADTNGRHRCLVSLTLFKCHSFRTMEIRAVLLLCSEALQCWKLKKWKKRRSSLLRQISKKLQEWLVQKHLACVNLPTEQ